MASEQRLQAAIVAYLKTKTSTVSDPDSLAVGIQCVQEAFAIDDSSIVTAQADINALLNAFKQDAGASDSIEADPTFRKFVETVTAKGYFDNIENGSPEYNDRYAKLVDKFKARQGAAAPAPAAAPANDDAAAEKLKEAGNKALTAGNFEEAVKQYTRALEAAPTGKNAHIYYTNRAAAKTSLKDYGGAVADARTATEVDPSYAKGWSRLGAALAASNKHSEAVAAYEKACDLDPSYSSAKEGMLASRKKASGSSSTSNASSVAPSSSAGSAGGAGGMPGGLPPGLGGLASMLGGGGGGMPDIAKMMQNPEIMKMAAQAMQNPEMMKMAANMLGGAGGLAGLAGMMGGMGGGMPGMGGAGGFGGAGGAGGANGGQVQDGDDDFADMPPLEKE